MTNNKLTSVPIDLLRKYDRPGPRYTSYPTAPIWSKEVGPETYEEILIKASRRTDESLTIYCHIPFCRQRCYFCACNTVITQGGDRVKRYLKMLEREINMTADRLGERKLVSQCHFGGGTPTFLSIKQLEPLLDCFDRNFTFTEDCEKSIEVDPRVTNHEQIDFLTERGFNRISIGVQDFDGEVQEAIGRIQSSKQVKDLVEHCRKRNFKGINLDLIYGLPKQTRESFAETIDKVLSLNPDRVAVYSFAYLPSLKANQMKIKAEELPSAERKYQLFVTAIEKFTAAGYVQIGMDHFARPEDELARALAVGKLHRNFMGYTVQAAPEMIAIGMSSIGYVENTFVQNFSRLTQYMDAIDNDTFAVYRGMRLSHDDLVRQYVISSLMCNFRLDFDKFRESFGVNFTDYFPDEHETFSEFFDDNLLRLSRQGLEVLPLGRTFVRNIAMSFDAYLVGRDGRPAPTFSRTI